MDDAFVIVMTAIFLVVSTAWIGVGLRRWARAGYRIRLNTLLLLMAVASFVSYLAVAFILPIAQHRWAFQVVRQSRGSFYRGEMKDDIPQAIHVKDPWGKFVSVTFDDDYQATSSARALRWLPELLQINFERQVTDVGIKSVLSRVPTTGLGHLSFICPNMTDAALENIGQVKSLESLFFMSSGITDEGLRQLKNVAGLTSLHLWEFVGERGVTDRNRFGPTGYAAIGQLKNLTFMRIRGYVVTDESSRQLHGLANLRGLSLVYCVISDAAIAELRSALPDCDITVSKCFGPDSPKPDWF